MRIKNNIVAVVFLILSALLTAFIFINSSLTAEVSQGESQSIMDLINQLFQNIGFSAEISDHIVRKLAHFCEFALLGVLSIGTVKFFTGKYFKNISVSLFWCLMSAVTDEFIQLFVEGRASMVTDVLIDFSGSITGILLCILVLWLIDKRITKRKGNGEFNGKRTEY